jgi:membrane protein required for colicin V production
MNIADLALGLVWGFFFIRGYFRGLVRELGALAALICGFYMARAYQGWLAPYLTEYVAGNYAGIAAYILLFTATLLCVWLLVLGVAGLVKVATAEWADHLFGGLFGLIKGVVLTAAVLFLFSMLSPDRPDFMTGSKLVPLLDKVSGALSGYVPENLMEKVRSIQS